MPLKLDTIEGAYFSQDDQRRVYRRTAIVSGVNSLGSGSPATVLYEATRVAGMPQYNDPFPSDPIARVINVEALGISDADDAVKVLITYATPTVKGQLEGGGTFVFEDDTTLTTDSAQFVPGSDKTPLLVTYDKVTPKIEYQGTINYHRPVRNVTLSGLSTSTQKIEAIRQAIGGVNDGKFANLDRGYWLIAGLQSRTTDLGKSYSLSVQLATRVDEDWSHYLVARDPRIGQYVKTASNEVTAAKNAPYKYGIIGQTDGKGFLRVGPYRTVNFSDLFGN